MPWIPGNKRLKPIKPFKPFKPFELFELFELFNLWDKPSALRFVLKFLNIKSDIRI